MCTHLSHLTGTWRKKSYKITQPLSRIFFWTTELQLHLLFLGLLLQTWKMFWRQILSQWFLTVWSFHVFSRCHLFKAFNLDEPGYFYLIFSIWNCTWLVMNHLATSKSQQNETDTDRSGLLYWSYFNLNLLFYDNDKVVLVLQS